MRTIGDQLQVFRRALCVHWIFVRFELITNPVELSTANSDWTAILDDRAIYPANAERKGHSVANPKAVLSASLICHCASPTKGARL
jgi:hypothetical protein